MFPESLEELIQHFSKFPSIGRKSAQRLALHLLKQKKDFAKSFAESIQNIHERIHFCSQCHNLAEADLCQICLDSRRDQSSIMLVVDFSDIFAVEKTSEYRGLYHVLGAVLSPLDGIGPDKLNLKSLLKRLDEKPVSELILALTASADGEATISYLMRLLEHRKIKISRIARGVPIGSQLEYIDQLTLGSAISGRSDI